MILIIAIAIVLPISLFFTGLFYLLQIQKKGFLMRSLNLTLLLATLPKEKIKEGESAKGGQAEKEFIAKMGQVYSSLYSLQEEGWKKFLYGQPYFALEIAVHHIGEEIHFYLAAPRRYLKIVEKQIQAAFPQIFIQPIKEDYNIFNPGGFSLGSYLSLDKGFVLPLKTFKDLEIDPLSAITNAFSTLKEVGEGAAIQILIRPAQKKWQKLGQKTAKLMQEGKSLEEALVKTHRGSIFDFLIEMAHPAVTKEKQPEQKPMTPLQQEIIKATENKANQAHFETNIRLIASAATQQEAETILSNLGGAFSQYNSIQLNGFRINSVRDRAAQTLFYNFAFRLFNNSQKMILSSEELTSLYHFPTPYLETPKIKFLKAKTAAPPVNLPKTDLILGKNIYRGEENAIRMSKEDRRRHLYVIGQTGTGKSTFLLNLIEQDIANGEGLAVIDPHGGLIDDVLALIPSERAEDVIMLDPGDLERPFGMNMLEYNSKFPEQKTFIVNELINIFDKLYDLKTTGGPLFEQYTRNALLLLLEYPEQGYTLMEVPRVLADAEFRKRLLAGCQNIVVKNFWEKEAEKAGGEAALTNMVPYITSKFNNFIANDYMRPIIGQSKSALNFREVMDKKKVLLVNLSKGRLGESNMSLLGLIFVGKILMAAYSRVDTPEELRPDFYLYIDEFQNFTTDSLASILSEARKYRLNLIAAHQFIAQLGEKIRDAVFGNVGSMFAMRVGPQDAEFLIKIFAPVFSETDLVNIDNYKGYLRLLIKGQTTAPFNIDVYPPRKGDVQQAQKIRELSRLKYGRPRELVEKEIRERFL